MTDYTPEPDEPGTLNDPRQPGVFDQPEPPRPVNWNLLTAHELEQEWLALNDWVAWLRRTYGLLATVIPPCWHRHPELLWELSALHLHWLCAYDPAQTASSPLGWHRAFADARPRLRAGARGRRAWEPPAAPGSPASARGARRRWGCRPTATASWRRRTRGARRPMRAAT